MYEDYHCLWYLLQSVCMSCVVIMHEDDQCLLYLLHKVFVCPVCNKMCEDYHCLLYLL